jgi:hypothetical protein
LQRRLIAYASFVPWFVVNLNPSRLATMSSLRSVTIFYVILVLSTGCGGDPRKSPPSLVRLDELEYHDPLIGQRLKAIDAAATRMSDSTWHHLPLQERWSPPAHGGGMDYYALWCLRSGRISHLCTEATERPVHCITVHASPHPQNPKKVHAVHLTVISYSAGNEWSAHLGYICQKAYPESARVQETFGISFLHEKWKTSESDAALSIPGGWHTLKKRFGHLEYAITLGPSGHSPWESQPARFLASAEALRDTALAVIDEAQPVMREQLLSGMGVVSVTDRREMNKRTGSPARFEPPLRAEYELSMEQRRAILDETMQELSRRRRLLREHYKELYAAAVQAFPLAECLKPIAAE